MSAPLDPATAARLHRELSDLSTADLDELLGGVLNDRDDQPAMLEALARGASNDAFDRLTALVVDFFCDAPCLLRSTDRHRLRRAMLTEPAADEDGGAALAAYWGLDPGGGLPA